MLLWSAPIAGTVILLLECVIVITGLPGPVAIDVCVE